MRLIEQILINGWSDSAVNTALSCLAVTPLADRDPDGALAAAELLRWLRHAAGRYGKRLADGIARLRPDGDATSAWDWLLQDTPIEPAVDALLSEYPNAAATICEELGRSVRNDTCWDDLNWHHQRYIQALIVIGSEQCLGFMSRHGGLLYGGDTRELWPYASRHAAGWHTAMNAAWNDMSWDARATAVMLIDDLELPVEEFVERVRRVVPLELPVADRVHYLMILSCGMDSDVTDIAHDLFGAALLQYLNGAATQLCNVDRSGVYALLRECLSYLDREDLTSFEVAAAIRIGLSFPHRAPSYRLRSSL